MAAGRKRRIEESKSSKKEDVIVLFDDNDDDDDDNVSSSSNSGTRVITSTNAPKPTATTVKSSHAQDESADTGTDDKGIEIKIPLSLLMTGTSAGSNECSVIVQVTPEDAPTMDFHGAGGAVGRFEVNDDTGELTLVGCSLFNQKTCDVNTNDINTCTRTHSSEIIMNLILYTSFVSLWKKVTMDLKGFQYQGVLQAGPTCIIASMHPLIGENIIKVESITDEFVTLQQTGDQLAQLDGVVEKGNLDDSFIVRDHNVNSRDRDRGGGSNAHADQNDDADKAKGKKKALANSGKETKPSKKKRKY
jgi:hypothetical protein